MTSTKRAQELLSPVFLRKLVEHQIQLPPDEALETLNQVRFGMDVAVNGPEELCPLLQAIVIADALSDMLNDGTMFSSSFMVLAVCLTDECASELEDVIARVCACLPERVEGEVLRVASYREIDENDEVALEAETAEVMRNAPHVLVGTAMGLKQFVGFVDSAFPAESVKMVCMNRTEEVLARITPGTSALLRMLYLVPNLRQLYMTGRDLNESKIKEKLGRYIHDLHVVDLPNYRKTAQTVSIDENTQAEQDTNGTSKKPVIYAGHDATYKLWLEDCAQVQWKIPGLPSSKEERNAPTPDEHKVNEPTSDWVTCWSAQYEQPYYYNKVTGQSTWKMP